MLNVVALVQSWDDAAGSNNPSRRLPDWRRSLLDVAAGDSSAAVLRLLPAQVATAFDGARSLTLDDTTALSLAMVANGQTRLEWTGTGTAPGFRTARAVNFDEATLTLTVDLAAQTMQVTSSTGDIFGSVSPGDEVFIPGVTTADPAGPFAVENEGRWVVLTASDTVLVLGRPYGAAFNGSSGDVPIIADTDFQVFSPDGVLVGDRLVIAGGFAAANQGTYTVQFVTARRLEFVRTAPTAAQSLSPGQGTVIVYSSAKRAVLVESDQEVALRYNGDGGTGCRLTPLTPGDPDGVGFQLKYGTAWSLVVLNLSAVPTKVRVLMVE